MEKCEVSVICTVYNHEEYLKKCLDGFISQRTNFNFEVIVHDDASTDHSASIIKEYENKYPTIIKAIYQKENQYSKAVNIVKDIMIPKAQGKYIALCEGDDYWIDNNKLQMQYDYIEKHPKCSLVSHFSYLYRERERIMEIYTPKRLLTSSDHILREIDIFSRHGVIHTSSLFFRKDYYYKYKSLLDRVKSYDYVYKMLLVTEGYFFVIPKIMSVYRYGSRNSWATTIGNTDIGYTKTLKEQNYFLNNLNVYTNHKYSEYIAECIRVNHFRLLKIRLDFRRMKSPKYVDLYNKMGILEKIALRIKWLSPVMYSFLYDHISPNLRILYNNIRYHNKMRYRN